MRISKIVSGGQTGVDRAALDAAISAGIEHGGWVPRERKAEDGPIPPPYQVVETPSDGYMERTLLNVRDSDATLIVARITLSGGTAYTQIVAKHLGKPCYVVLPDGSDDEQKFSLLTQWVRSLDGTVLNVAGPREADEPGIYESAHELLTHLLLWSQSQSVVGRPTAAPSAASILKAWEYHKDADSQLHSRLGFFMAAQAFLIASYWSFIPHIYDNDFVKYNKVGLLSAIALLGILYSVIMCRMCWRLTNGIEALKQKYLNYDSEYRTYIIAARGTVPGTNPVWPDIPGRYPAPLILAGAPGLFWLYILYLHGWLSAIVR
jgi:hypothetical protein